MFKPYKYIKAVPAVKESRAFEFNLPSFRFPPLNFRKIFSVIFIFAGVYLLGSQIVFPLLMAQKTTEEPLLKPVLGGTVGESEPFFVFSELGRVATSSLIGTEVVADLPPIFYITIPKLEIEKAEAETNSPSLSPDERLGHYTGSALPGQVGNTFIYGHSVLPMFYNPKNYKTIFSTLDKLVEGDELVVEFGEQVYKYVVEKQQVLETKDVNPLDPIAPRFLNQAYLTLMTCWPPGLKDKRLLVQARLVL